MRFINIIIVLLVFLPFTYADFSAWADNGAIDVCACSIISNDIYVKATTQETALPVTTFQLSQEGSAAKWSTVYPDNFIVEVGGYEKINNQIHVPCDGKGSYDLVTLVKSSKSAKALAQAVNVEKCDNIVAQVKSSALRACPCSPAVFEVAVTNPLSFPDTYEIEIEEPRGFEGTLSSNLKQVTLGPDESGAFEVFASSTCDLNGKFSIPVKLTSLVNKQTFKTTLVLDVEPCNEFVLETGAAVNPDEASYVTTNESYKFCAGQKKAIPFKLTNKAPYVNNFDLSLDSKLGVLSFDRVDNLSTDGSVMGLIGIYSTDVIEEDIELTIASNSQDLKKTYTIPVSFENCYSLEIESPSRKVSLVEGENWIPVTLSNTGATPAKYTLGYAGPAWTIFYIQTDAGLEVMPKVLVEPNESVSGYISANLTNQTGSHEVVLSGRLISPNAEFSETILLRTRGPVASFISDYWLWLIPLPLILLLLLVLIFIKKLGGDKESKPKKKKVKAKRAKVVKKESTFSVNQLFKKVDRKPLISKPKKKESKDSKASMFASFPWKWLLLLLLLIVLLLGVWYVIPMFSGAATDTNQTTSDNVSSEVVIDESGIATYGGNGAEDFEVVKSANKSISNETWWDKFIVFFKTDSSSKDDFEVNEAVVEAEASKETVEGVVESNVSFAESVEESLVESEVVSNESEGKSEPAEEVVDIYAGANCTFEVYPNKPLVVNLSKSFNDPDNDSLSFSYAPSPEHVSVDFEGDIITLSVDSDYLGLDQIGFQATDSNGAVVDSGNLTICVKESNETFMQSATDFVYDYRYYILIGFMVLLVLLLVLHLYETKPIVQEE